MNLSLRAYIDLLLGALATGGVVTGLYLLGYSALGLIEAVKFHWGLYISKRSCEHQGDLLETQSSISSAYIDTSEH